MSAIVTSIERNEAGTLIYRNAGKDILFLGSSNAHIRPRGQVAAIITDISGKGVDVLYDSFASITIEGTTTSFSGNFQDFLDLLQSLLKPICGGSTPTPVGAEFELLYYVADGSVSTASTTFVNYNTFSQTLEKGVYRAEFYAQVETVGRDAEIRMVVNGIGKGKTSDFAWLFSPQFFGMYSSYVFQGNLRFRQ